MSSKQGLFGKTKAFVLSIEEQARKTLHAHFQIWIKDYHTIREKIYNRKRSHKECSKYLCDSFDNIASCSFFLVIRKKYKESIKVKHLTAQLRTKMIEYLQKLFHLKI